MAKVDYTKMDETQLAEAYNGLLGDRKIKGHKLMETAFTSTNKGLKKVEALVSLLEAEKAAEKEAKKAAKEAKKAGKATPEAAAAAEDSSEEPKKRGRKAAAPVEQGPPLKVSPGQLVETLCGNRVQTHKGVLLQYLVDNIKTMTPVSKLLKHVYGKDAPGKETAFTIRVRDIMGSIHKKNVPFELKSEKEGKEVSIGLYPVKG